MRAAVALLLLALFAAFFLETLASKLTGVSSGAAEKSTDTSAEAIAAMLSHQQAYLACECMNEQRECKPHQCTEASPGETTIIGPKRVRPPTPQSDTSNLSFHLAPYGADVLPLALGCVDSQTPILTHTI